MLGTWSEHVDELLYDGERVKRRVDLEGATVVVTNDRVLVFTEGGAGSNYRTIERPNVSRISVETEESLGQLIWATVVLFIGVGLLLIATTYDLADLVAGFDVEGTTGITGGALGTVETLLTAFDLSLLVAGAFFALLSAVFFVRYIRSRSRRLLLRVSGDDIALPVTDADLENDRTIALEEAIGPGVPPDSDVVTGESAAGANGTATSGDSTATAEARPDDSDAAAEARMDVSDPAARARSDVNNPTAETNGAGDGDPSLEADDATGTADPDESG